MIESIRNIRQHQYIPLDKGVECEVKFTEVEYFIPYFAMIDDCELIGREIYNHCLSGHYGEVLQAKPLTKEENTLIVEDKKNILLKEASNIIAPLKDAKEGGYIEDEDIPRLIAWQKYRYALTKIDITCHPNIIWPEKPQ